MTSTNRFSLIAACGMNCGICRAYLREKNKCPGCRYFDKSEPVSITRCKIKNCGMIQKGKVKFCFECESFPCEPVKHLDKRYRTKYGMSMIENLEHIQNLGIRKFLANERIRWACPECGGTICVHGHRCHSCGKDINPESVISGQ